MTKSEHPIPDDIFTAKTQSHPEAGKIAILTTDGTEDQEFFYPYYRFLEEGFTVHVLTPNGKGFKGKNGAGLSETKAVGEADASLYAMLYIPGGKAPAKLKKEQEAVQFVKDFCATGKPVGSICHGPQLLAEADVIKGKSIAAWPECQKEVEQAGAHYQYTACVHDGQFITGRWPADLPAQMKEIMQVLKAAPEAVKKAA